jgi:hypothetical protein
VPSIAVPAAMICSALPPPMKLSNVFDTPLSIASSSFSTSLPVATVGAPRWIAYEAVEPQISNELMDAIGRFAVTRSVSVSAPPAKLSVPSARIFQIARSSPAPPSMVSSPPRPMIVSFPPLPLSLLAAPSPIRISAAEPP